MDYNKKKHEIGFLRADGTTKVGLMLAKDKNGQPIYQTWNDSFTQERYITSDVPGYGGLNPENEVKVGQNSWEAGLGKEIYDSQSPKRSWDTRDLDTRVSYKAKAGLLDTAPTLPTLPSITDGGLETWTDANNLTNWTKAATGSGSLARDDTNERSGTYCALLNSGTGTILIYQNITGYTIGTTITVEAWVKTSFAIQALELRDDSGTTSCTAHTGGGAYEKLSVTRQVSAGASYFRIYIYIAGASQTLYVDDIAITATYGGTRHWAEFNDDHYFFSGNVLLKVEGADGSIKFVASFPADITWIEPFSDSRLYICLGLSNGYWYMNTSEACTASTTTVKNFKYMAFVRTTADTMYASDGVNTIRSNATPTADTWSGQTTIDTSYNEITALLTFQNALYILKDDRPYYLSSAGAVQTLTDDTASLPRVTSTYSLQNGMNSCEWKGKLYMPYGNTLLRYDPDTGAFRWLHPSVTCSNSDYKDKLIAAVYGDEDYLYMLMQNGTTGYLFAGRDETIDGVSQWVWHNIATLAATTGCQSLSISSVYERRIWVGASVNTAIKYLKEGVYVSAGYMETPYLHANFLGDSKAWVKMTLTMEDTTANVYWDASYKKLGDSSWTSIGSFKTSPRTTAYIPVDGSSVNPVSVWMKFKLDAITNSSASTPVLRDIDIRAVLYSSRRQLIECEVICADDLTDKDGIRLEANANLIGTVLDEAADATYPVTFYDIYATTKTVKLLPVKPYSWVTKSEKGRNPEKHYHLLMQEVTISAGSGTSSSPYYLNYLGTAITFIIDGASVAITTGEKGHIKVPFNCTITSWDALADQSGSIQVDIWKDTYANFPPTNADTITAANEVIITTATKATDSTLTGWTKAISSGDILAFNVDSCTTITRVTITLNVTRT